VCARARACITVIKKFTINLLYTHIIQKIFVTIDIDII